MIRLIKESNGYKYYSIDIQDVWQSAERQDAFVSQLDIILTGQDAYEGYKLGQVIAFQDVFIVVLTIR